METNLETYENAQTPEELKQEIYKELENLERKKQHLLELLALL